MGRGANPLGKEPRAEGGREGQCPQEADAGQVPPRRPHPVRQPAPLHPQPLQRCRVSCRIAHPGSSVKYFPLRKYMTGPRAASRARPAAARAGRDAAAGSICATCGAEPRHADGRRCCAAGGRCPTPRRGPGRPCGSACTALSLPYRTLDRTRVGAAAPLPVTASAAPRAGRTRCLRRKARPRQSRRSLSAAANSPTPTSAARCSAALRPCSYLYVWYAVCKASLLHPVEVLSSRPFGSSTQTTNGISRDGHGHARRSTCSSTGSGSSPG